LQFEKLIFSKGQQIIDGNRPFIVLHDSNLGAT